MDDKFDRKAIISYLLPSIDHARYEAFVSMVMYLRQMAKDLYGQNEIVREDENGEKTVIAQSENTNSSNDQMKRVIDEILPSLEDMQEYSDKCRYYHHQFVYYMAAQYKDIAKIVDKKYPPEIPLAIKIHDVIAVEKGK
jgi:hypothetical protein